jgi:hypothetical protein
VLPLANASPEKSGRFAHLRQVLLGDDQIDQDDLFDMPNK